MISAQGRRIVQWSMGALGAAAGAWAARATITWLRYGHPAKVADPLLDRFMHEYEVAERHHIDVAAPASVAFAAAREMALFDSPAINAVFRAREIVLRTPPEARRAGRARGIVEYMRSNGWVLLDESPNHEIVMGAATQPWEPHVVFRPVAREEFAAFNEPDYVKIVWMIRVDAAGDRRSVVRTETRAIATNPRARAKFRRYWALFSPGIVLIRRLMLRRLRGHVEAGDVLSWNSSKRGLES
jgi:hypothetical protein